MGSIQASSCGLFNTCLSVEGNLKKAQNAGTDMLEDLIQQLFKLQDLNGNGVLEEEELIQLNKKVAMLHHGKDIDKEEIKAKYQELFRDRLNADGEPVSSDIFRNHILDVLQGIDSSKVAQSYILEQWIAEADQARLSFQMPSFHSISDVPFLLVMPKASPEGEGTKVDTPPVASFDSAHVLKVSAPPPSEMASMASTLSNNAMTQLMMSIGSKEAHQMTASRSFHKTIEEHTQAQPQSAWVWPQHRDATQMSEASLGAAETRSLGSSQGPL